jgi:hypothetical protein
MTTALIALIPLIAVLAIALSSHQALAADVCKPVDKNGAACLSIVGNTATPRADGGKVYTLTFNNSCERRVFVDAQYRLKQDRGVGVHADVNPGSTADLVCIDHPSGRPQCGGFGTWEAGC